MRTYGRNTQGLWCAGRENAVSSCLCREEPMSSSPPPPLPSLMTPPRCRDVAIMYNAAGNKNKSN